jgi:hypothetical protein
MDKAVQGDKYAIAHRERQKYVDAVVGARTDKKLVVAGPGTGKTYLFTAVLQDKILSVNKIYFLLGLWYRFSRMTPYVNGRNHGQYTVPGSLGCVLGQGGAVDPSAGT